MSHFSLFYPVWHHVFFLPVYFFLFSGNRFIFFSLFISPCLSLSLSLFLFLSLSLSLSLSSLSLFLSLALPPHLIHTYPNRVSQGIHDLFENPVQGSQTVDINVNVTNICDLNIKNTTSSLKKVIFS